MHFVKCALLSPTSAPHVAKMRPPKLGLGRVKSPHALTRSSKSVTTSAALTKPSAAQRGEALRFALQGMPQHQNPLALVTNHPGGTMPIRCPHTHNYSPLVPTCRSPERKQDPRVFIFSGYREHLSGEAGRQNGYGPALMHPRRQLAGRAVHGVTATTILWKHSALPAHMHRLQSPRSSSATSWQLLAARKAATLQRDPALLLL